MIVTAAGRRAAAIATAVMLSVAGCAFQGVNSLPLPGAQGHGPGASTYRVDLANVGTLEPNSPVLIDDVAVGSIADIAVVDRHAVVTVHVNPGVVVPANSIATVGQTSLLGSMHLALGPPVGQPATGQLPANATIALNRSSTYPSTERTLAALSVVANAGGLGQLGDVIHTLNTALNGHQADVRSLLNQLDTFVTTLNTQRDDIIETITELNRFAGTLAGQQATITAALQHLPPALDVLVAERPRLTTALEKLHAFSDTATGVVNATTADLLTNLKNLAPTVKALSDVGPDIDTALAYLPVAPLGQNLIDRGLRGDYMNLFVTADLTNARLKRGLGLGTRYGDQDISQVPAPGDPGYDAYYSHNPLGVGVAPPPADAPPSGEAPAPPPSTDGGHH
jgi:phospholipid/cholesterol/gamma-HCH transport system substrate-binding protein